MVLQSHRRVEFHCYFVYIALSNGVNLSLFKAIPVEDILRSVEESDQDLADGLLVAVLDEVVQHLWVSVHVLVHLLGLVANEDCKDLEEVAAEHGVQLLVLLQEGEQFLKEFVFIGFLKLGVHVGRSSGERLILFNLDQDVVLVVWQERLFVLLVLLYVQLLFHYHILLLLMFLFLLLILFLILFLGLFMLLFNLLLVSDDGFNLDKGFNTVIVLLFLINSFQLVVQRLFSLQLYLIWVHFLILLHFISARPVLLAL